MYLDKSSSEIINEFKLSPHPEGGWFREIIRSKNHVTRNDGQKRSNITSIYYLLCKSERSKWHRVNSSDEIWICLLYTSPSPRDGLLSRMPSSA